MCSGSCAIETGAILTVGPPKRFVCLENTWKTHDNGAGMPSQGMCCVLATQVWLSLTESPGDPREVDGQNRRGALNFSLASLRKRA